MSHHGPSWLAASLGMTALIMGTSGAIGVLAQSPDVAPSPAASGSASAAECGSGGSLRVARKEEPTSIVPWNSVGNGNIYFQVHLYDHLVEALPGSTEPQPGLAESWEIAPDGLSYTFHLRPATFSNGDPVTAEDVKFSMDRMIDPNVQVDWAFLMVNIDGFEVVDESTIRMDMKAIDASVLHTLTMPGGAIYSKAAFEEMGEEAFSQNPVGSGPFMMRSWTPGQTIEAVPNPHHWRTDRPYVDEITFQYIPDASARAVKALSGEADIIEDIAFEQVQQVDDDPSVSVQIEPKFLGWYVTLNHTYPPFGDKLIRQALNYATDKDAINEVVLSGLGTPSNSMWAQRGAFWDPTVQPYPYDIDKAKALMGESSFPDGFDVEILIGAGYPGSLQAAQIIQSLWAQLGVNVQINVLDGTVHWDRLSHMNYQASMAGPTDYTSDSYDDNEIASIFLDYSDTWRSWFSGWNDPEASRLVRAANGTVDLAERAELYSQLQRHAMEEAVSVTLLNAPSTNAKRDNVEGFHTLPLGWWRSEDVCFVQ